jgi:hypothetical protein
VQLPTLLFFRRSRWRLSVKSLGFYVLDSILKPVAGIELSKEVFTSRVRWMPLIVEWNASVNMFYLLKSLLLLILVIFKIKCNNLILNKIRALNISYAYLHAFSLHRELPDPDPGRQISYFWGDSVTTNVSLLPRVERKFWEPNFLGGVGERKVGALFQAGLEMLLASLTITNSKYKDTKKHPGRHRRRV